MSCSNRNPLCTRAGTPLSSPSSLHFSAPLLSLKPSDLKPIQFCTSGEFLPIVEMLPLIFYALLFLLKLADASPSSSSSTIYDILRLHGLPMGLLPKGIKDFKFDESGQFEVYLDQACNAKFESELHYDRNVTGTLSYGQIGALSGISAQELFLWFPVREIRVDIPSSGIIYFDVGVVFKQFSLSLFETPPDCTAVRSEDLGGFVEGRSIDEVLSEVQTEPEKPQYRIAQE